MTKPNTLFALLAFTAVTAQSAELDVVRVDQTRSFDNELSAASAGMTGLSDDDHESAGFVVESNGKFYVTSLVSSEANNLVNMNVRVKIQKDAKLVAYFHNHPGGDEQLANKMSSTDLLTAKQMGINGYMVNQNKIYRLTPENKTATIQWHGKNIVYARSEYVGDLTKTQ